MHQDLLQLQACQNPLDDQKHKSLRSWYSEITLIDVLRHVDQKLPIPREHFWAITFFVDRNDINNFGPKGQPFKTTLTWGEILRLGRPSMAGIVARSRQIVKMKKKKKRKINCHVKHLKNSIRPKQESRKQKKKMLKKWWKLHTHESLFPLARNHSSV